jgi:hypothetical protein
MDLPEDRYRAQGYDPPFDNCPGKRPAVYVPHVTKV